MMKSLAMLLAVAMLFGLTACGGKMATTATTSATTSAATTVTTTSATDTQSPTATATTTTESVESSTSTDEQTTTVIPSSTRTEQTKTPQKTTTQKSPTHVTTNGNGGAHEHSFVMTDTTLTDCSVPWVEHYVCACGTMKTVNHMFSSHQWSEWETTKAPTFEKTGEAKRQCSVCKKTETQTLAKRAPYYVSHEIVSKTLPNAHYIGGVDLLSKLFGENNAFQTGDTIVYKINMSDGSANGFELLDTSGCTVTINGNMATVKITGDFSRAEWALKTTDKNGAEKTVLVSYDYILRFAGNIVDAHQVADDVFIDYARAKYGITRDQGITPEEGYTSSRTSSANDPSITGEHGNGYYGTLDDCIFKDKDKKWVETVLWLIDEYNKIGIKAWELSSSNGFIGAVARK